MRRNIWIFTLLLLFANSFISFYFNFNYNLEFYSSEFILNKSYIPAIYFSPVIFFLLIVTNLSLLKKISFRSKLINYSGLLLLSYLLSVWIISNYFSLNTILFKEGPQIIAGIVKSLKEESTHRIVIFYNYDLDREIAIDVSIEDYSKINLNDSIRFKLYEGRYNILFDDRISVLNGGRIRPIGYE